MISQVISAWSYLEPSLAKFIVDDFIPEVTF